ncbi:hypothetical protein RESH_05953 [Rhodopirellula europaea SH398]|uniref:Uncharacterized protein n=1 Tax=Rhodopirellula europaea SH398 TaxID=1263868 RepID=M5RVX7_9BACT|nr:hypothetical protein RESH_05953 [Rhodopirellula europaea SH398]
MIPNQSASHRQAALVSQLNNQHSVASPSPGFGSVPFVKQWRQCTAPRSATSGHAANRSRPPQRMHGCPFPSI